MNLNPCSPAEASFALSMVQDRSFQSGHRVASFFVAEAIVARVERTTRPIPFTDREIATAVFGSSVTRARQVVADLERRGVIERTHRGTNGNDPSEARFLHPTHWDVALARGIDREEFGQRLTRFSAALTGALIDSSARVHRTRAPMASAVSISGLNDALARADSQENTRAGFATARTRATKGVDPRAGARRIPFSSRDEISHSLEGGSEGESIQDPRGDELLEAIKRGGGGRKIWGLPAKRVRYIAQECNGRLPELVSIAAATNGPAQTMAILGELEVALRRPAGVRSSAQPVGHSDRLRRDLETAERIGDEESAEGLRQALATMEL